mmetsp:Transcript_23749/g.22852  ORF Transcript_23749/g.22852 Transcript_23749/m.22852 type:complete len:358 (+) Transcript_23749:608-1681(+)
MQGNDNGKEKGKESKFPKVDKELIEAAKMNDIEKVNQCLENGTKVNATDYKGRTALHWACNKDKGFLDIVKLLILWGADKEAKDKKKKKNIARNGSTPIQFAISYKHPDVVEYLLGIGSEVVSLKDTMKWGIENDYIGVVRALIERGVDVNSPLNEQGYFSLHFAAEGGFLVMCQMLLLEYGAHIDQPSVYLWTPLLSAVDHGHDDVVGFLLDNNANIEAKTQEGKTSLHLAVMGGYEIVVQNLLGREGNRNALCEVDGYTECTVMHLAAYNGDIKMAELLIKNDVFLDARDGDGDTPLFMAIFKHKNAMTKFLIDEGASKTSVNKKLIGLVEYTKKYGNLYAIRYIDDILKKSVIM